MKRKVFVPLISVFFYGALFLSDASAGLIEADLFAPDDRLLTIDSDAELEWLDLSATLGMSYNEAADSTYVIDLGFRFASADEVATLYLDAGGVDVPGASAENLEAVLLLLDLMGCTTQCVTGEPAGQGYFDTTVLDPDFAGYSFFQGSPIIGDGDFSIFDFAAAPPKELPPEGIPNLWRQSTGSFFVREIVAVPEPSTLSLFAIGLAGLGVMSRRRRKRADAA